jgi:hypothetical protein
LSLVSLSFVHKVVGKANGTSSFPKRLLTLRHTPFSPQTIMMR